MVVAGGAATIVRLTVHASRAYVLNMHQCSHVFGGCIEQRGYVSDCYPSTYVGFGIVTARDVAVYIAFVLVLEPRVYMRVCSQTASACVPKRPEAGPCITILANHCQGMC